MIRSAKHIFTGWRTVILLAILGLLLGVIGSFFEPLKYRSSVRVLITQNVGIVDAYTASRSSERIADDISSIVHTTSFFNAVSDAGFNIGGSYFPSDDRRRRSLWKKTVQPTVLRGSGLMQVDVFHPSVDQAEQIARAIAFVLTTRAGEFVSGGGVSVRLVDEPLNSRYPVKPNIPVNALGGLIIGGLAGVGIVFVQSERLRRRHQMIHEEW